MSVTVMLTDESAVTLPYDDAVRLYIRLRWALDRAQRDADTDGEGS